MQASSNPLLTFTDLPPFSQIKPEMVKPAVETAIAQSREAVERVLAAANISWHTIVISSAGSGRRCRI